MSAVPANRCALEGARVCSGAGKPADEWEPTLLNDLGGRWQYCGRDAHHL